MTFKNRKFRYDIYVERGLTEHAEALAKRYPDVLPKAEAPKKEKPKTVSKKKGG